MRLHISKATKNEAPMRRRISKATKMRHCIANFAPKRSDVFQALKK